MDPWPKIDHRDRNSLYETFDRENMLDSITEQGDGWLLRIFEVVSELDRGAIGVPKRSTSCKVPSSRTPQLTA